MIKDNKTILVFAGTSGIGSEICEKFSREGYNVVYTSTSNKKLSIQKKKLIVNNHSIGTVCNLKNEKSISKTIKFALSKFNIDVIVNCGGIFQYDGIKKIKVSNLLNHYRVNSVSTILINKYLEKFKKKNKKIKFFSIGSSSSYDGFSETISYCASKHALMGAIKSINKELIKKKIYNISVNPGSVKTKMGKKVKNQNYNNFIKPSSISNTIFNISKLENPTFVEDIYLRRIY